MGHHHRAGSLRQSNKRHKSSSSSKRSLDRQAGSGRVKIKNNNTPTGIKKGVTTSLAGSKANRIHAAQQRREKSKQQLLIDRRRPTANSSSVSQKVIVVGIIALSGESTEEAASFEELVRDTVASEASSSISRCFHDNTACASVSCRFEGSKVMLTLLTNSTAFYQCNLKMYQRMVAAEDALEDAAIHAALDLVRICDVVVFCLDGDFTNNRDDCAAMMSERGERMLTALKAQGLPTPITVVCFGTNNSIALSKKLKHRGDMKRYAQRMATTEFGQDAKVLEVNLVGKKQENDFMDINEVDQGISEKESCNKSLEEQTADLTKRNSIIVRTLCHSSFRPCKWSDMRSHMVSDGGYCEGDSIPGFSYNTDTKELSIQGYLRGAPPLDVNSLVHVPHLGTFAIRCVMNAAEPLLVLKHKRTKKNSHDGINIKTITNNDGSPNVLVASDPSMRSEPLNPYASPNSLEGEQNLIGFDNDDDDDPSFNDDNERTDTESSRGPRPAGWSDYQVSWLDALGDANHSDDEDEDIDHGELGAILNIKSRVGSSSGGMMEEDDDLSISSMERAALAEQRNKEHKRELDFPDEVELKRDELARERFARYRSLKSFRKSHWDPKENLPESYADIYHFASFKATQNDVLNEVKFLTDAANTAQLERGWKAGSLQNDNDVEMDVESAFISGDKKLHSCVASGSYVRVILEGVPQSAYESLQGNSLLSMVSLLPHENKISVLHMGVCQTSTCEPGKIPVKSKDLLTFRCGWRTWQGRPIFSQNNLNSDKHKYERFLPANAFVAVSVFGPVSYTPCPVLVFREPSKDNSRRQLVALGSMIGADADRVVIKRIVLTGYPVRVHKRNATVKYMFFNPDDVKWFKPAGLTTKHGLQGHIVESVGEHGTMKCLFNKPIKQHDTVCLPLYKRVYPKYENCSSADGERSDNDDFFGKKKLLVL